MDPYVKVSLDTKGSNIGRLEHQIIKIPGT